MSNFVYNCLDDIRDKKDERDFQLATVMPTEIALPNKFICKNLSPVFRQKYGSCTSACSVNGVKEQQERIGLSEYFNYVNSKKISGIYNQEGEWLKNALKAICNYGVCTQELFPDVYPPDRLWSTYVRKEPSPEAYINARKYRGKTYWSISNSIDNFKKALVTYETPITFVMKWYRSFNACTGVLPLPDTWVGNHAVACVGYNEKYLIVKNSFGEAWGDKGYFYIPFKDWNKYSIYNIWILLDLQNNTKKMKLTIDSNDDQYLVEESCKFGVSIANPEMLGNVVEHFAKLNQPLGEPVLTDMTSYFIMRGATAKMIKEFFNF